MIHNMHQHIQNVLEHPMFTDDTRRLTMLLVSGIRNGVWVASTVVHGTPEKGCKITMDTRSIDSKWGYYEIYVHDNYFEIFIVPERGRRARNLNLSATRTDETWDLPFLWEDINTSLACVHGRRS